MRRWDGELLLDGESLTDYVDVVATPIAKPREAFVATDIFGGRTLYVSGELKADIDRWMETELLKQEAREIARRVVAQWEMRMQLHGFVARYLGNLAPWQRQALESLLT